MTEGARFPRNPGGRGTGPGSELWLCNTGHMSLRDYFAGQALAGLYAHSAAADVAVASKLAYEAADAMIKAREL